VTRSGPGRFNSKTGKQTWEHPGGSAGAVAGAPADAPVAAGEKRKVPDVAPQAAHRPPPPNPAAAAAVAHSGTPKPAGEAGGKPSSPTKKPAQTAPATGGLASLLSSIQSSARAPTEKELERKRKKKQQEEALMSEVKAERENYKKWVCFQLDAFIEEGREYFEFPPSDSVHRIIAKDEAEERGCVAISHGEKEEEKRVFVFPDGKGPNQRESRYLQMGGTVQELVERRAKGDTFQEYNTSFTLNDAKLVTRTRQKGGGEAEDDEDEIQSRTINDRNVDASKAKALASKLKEAREEQAQAFLGEDD
jgi:hypothetical protein